MLKPHRLVGWWLSGGLVGLSVPALAQSTASFPEDPPRGAPAPAAAPAPTPSPAAPAPTPTPAPVAPAPTPVAAPTPAAPPAWPTPVAPLPAPSYVAPSVAGTPSAGVDFRPPLLPYREGLPVPPGYEVVKRPATGLIAGGLVGMGVAYAGGLAFAAVSGFKNGTAWLAVPVVGPWGAIGGRNYEQCRTRTVAEAKACVRNAVKEVQVITFFAVDGIGQLAGSLVTLAGVLSTKEELVRSDLVPKLDVTVVPPVAGNPLTLSVRGDF